MCMSFLGLCESVLSIIQATKKFKGEEKPHPSPSSMPTQGQKRMISLASLRCNFWLLPPSPTHR